MSETTVEALERIIDGLAKTDGPTFELREVLATARHERHEMTDELQHWHDRAIEAEAQLSTQAEELERLREAAKAAKSALVVALHYTEADYAPENEDELIGCRVALANLRQALQPPTQQGDKK
jgi:predicted  nucleic acid-binding Zn-ribbon protein